MAGEHISTLELTGIRLDVEQLFRDTCRIERRDDSAQTLNTSTAALTTPLTVLHNNLRCAIYPIMSRRDRFDEFGGGLIFTRQYRLAIPHDIVDVQVRDLVTILTSDDPQVIGRLMEVRDVVVSTAIGYRRLTLQDSRE